jgi:hypothetical protein
MQTIRPPIPGLFFLETTPLSWLNTPDHQNTIVKSGTLQSKRFVTAKTI